MNDKLGWLVKGGMFEDGSRLSGWKKIFQSPDWHWQYDTHEMTFAIYEHDSQYWKLYQVRYVKPDDQSYSYDFGGVACRVVLVEYLNKAGSPHSAKLMDIGEQEWIRTYEYQPLLHKVVKAGAHSAKYGEPYETRDLRHKGAV